MKILIGLGGAILVVCIAVVLKTLADTIAPSEQVKQAVGNFVNRFDR